MKTADIVTQLIENHGKPVPMIPLKSLSASIVATARFRKAVKAVASAVWDTRALSFVEAVKVGPKG